MIAIPNRRVAHGLVIPRCTVRIRENAKSNVRVRFMSCDCVQEISECIAQNADKGFNFTDTDATDYSLAAEITFDIWEKNKAGFNVYSASLTGGEITLIADNVFTLTIDNAASGALPLGRNYCEAWVTMLGGKQRMVGSGVFTVIDTRKHD